MENVLGCIGIMTWYDKYKNFPYKHLGNDPNTGIDCFNLIRLVYKQELNIDIPYTTATYCKVTDIDWYNKDCGDPFRKFWDSNLGWKEKNKRNTYKEILTPFDVLVMCIPPSNNLNHTALYLGENKLLHIMIERPSWIGPFGSYYEDCTMGVFKWVGMPKNIKN